jgi:hypothetical protein
MEMRTERRQTLGGGLLALLQDGLPWLLGAVILAFSFGVVLVGLWNDGVTKARMRPVAIWQDGAKPAARFEAKGSDGFRWVFLIGGTREDLKLQVIRGATTVFSNILHPDRQVYPDVPLSVQAKSSSYACQIGPAHQWHRLWVSVSEWEKERDTVRFEVARSLVGRYSPSVRIDVLSLKEKMLPLPSGHARGNGKANAR